MSEAQENIIPSDAIQSPDTLSDQEVDKIMGLRDAWFEGKNDEALMKRIDDTVEELRVWTCENGAKKEPPFPPNIQKIRSDFSLDEEGFYYRFSQDAPDPYMLWAIDTENDPHSRELSKGPIFRLIKDNESNVTIIDVHDPSEGKKGQLQIGLSIIRRNVDNTKNEVVNFPLRDLSRLSGQELKYTDLYLRAAKENLALRVSGNTTPTIRAPRI